MKALGITAAALATLIAAPAVAEDTTLGEAEIENYAEMLAMGDICGQVDYGVRRDALADWVAERLTGRTQADVDAVLDLRDSKLASLERNADRLREMPRTNRRMTQADEHYSQVISRCRRMTRDDVTSRFFGSDPAFDL